MTWRNNPIACQVVKKEYKIIYIIWFKFGGKEQNIYMHRKQD